MVASSDMADMADIVTRLARHVSRSAMR